MTSREFPFAIPQRIRNMPGSLSSSATGALAMLEWISSPEAWVALATLTALEIVLGIDNIIFISILTGRLPEEQREKARKIGLVLAMGMRIVLLFMLSWVMGLTANLFWEISGRDLILIGGGLFLLAKSTMEIHHKLEGDDEGHGGSKAVSFGSVLAQIALLDVVFSLDSVITAVGMAKHLPVMILAVVISIVVMLLGRERDRRLRREAPDLQDPRVELPPADRLLPGRRGLRAAHQQGLPLLRDGLLAVRRVPQLALPQAPQARHAARADGGDGEGIPGLIRRGRSSRCSSMPGYFALQPPQLAQSTMKRSPVSSSSLPISRQQPSKTRTSKRVSFLQQLFTAQRPRHSKTADPTAKGSGELPAASCTPLRR